MISLLLALRTSSFPLGSGVPLTATWNCWPNAGCYWYGTPKVPRSVGHRRRTTFGCSCIGSARAQIGTVTEIDGIDEIDGIVLNHIYCLDLI